MRTIKTIKRKLGLFLFAGGVGALFIAASTAVSGKSLIRNRIVISAPGTYTLGQDIDLSADTTGQPIIKIVTGGVVIDFDGHTITGPDGIAVIDVLPGVAADQPVVIRDGRVRGGDIGARSAGASMRYENMTFAESVSHLIDTSNGDIILFNVKLRMAGASALNIHGQAGDAATVTDTSILGTGGDAIHVHGAASLELARTTIRDAALCALMVSNDTASASEVSIADSRVIDSGRDGYHLAGKVALTVEGGLLRHVGRHGVYVAGADQPVSVKDLAAQDIGTLAFKIHGGGTTEITGNRIRGVGQSADFGPGGAVEIDGNGGPAVATISSNSVAPGGPASGDSGGPMFVIRPGTTARVLDNTITGAELAIVTHGRDTLIQGNRLRRIGTTGISLLNDGAVVRGNTITGRAEGWAGAGATAGILAGNGNHNILVEDNRIGGFAVGVIQFEHTDWDYLFLRDNLFDGNGTHVVGGTDAGGNIFGFLPTIPQE
jgi:hypothetical protein